MLHKEEKQKEMDKKIDCNTEAKVSNLADGEYHFAELIWENEPINSTALVKLAAIKLGWKKATVYTVLRKLCEKGIMKNNNAMVESIVPKEQIQQIASEEFMCRNFDNSIPAFLSAFIKNRPLKKGEIEEIKRMLTEAEHEDD